MLTIDQFKTIFPGNKEPEKYLAALTSILPTYGITTPERIAMFLAQCGHESAGFSVFQENLNYSAQGLRGTFSKYFTDDVIAARYARQPQWIASRVYANRMGNSNENSQDGWKYRGRGPIQLTGKANYLLFSRFMWNDDTTAISNPDIILDMYIGLHAACFYWQKNKLNDFADSKDVKGATKIINGGTNGLEERQQLYTKIVNFLSGS